MLKRKIRKVQALPAAGPRKASGGMVLGAFPHARRNPFQRMLYAAPGERDLDIVMLDRPEALAEIAAGRPAIAHYHWVHSLFDGMKSSRAAGKAAKSFIAHLQQQKDAGTGIVWTVHNILSHRRRFPEEELAVRMALGSFADVIHVMNPETVTLAAPRYRLDPSKVRHVPHPSYHGVYPAYQGREAARRALGLAADEVALLAFGMIEPYKGLRTFLASLDALQDSFAGKARALVAGRPSDKDFLAEVADLVRGRNDIVLHPEPVDDQALQTWFRASDVVMCPYPNGLNSGVAQTAMSFGRPVVTTPAIAPTLPGIEGAVSLFDPANPASLVAATLAAASAARQPGLEGTLLDWAARLAPESVSTRFFAMLEAEGLLPTPDRSEKKA